MTATEEVRTTAHGYPFRNLISISITVTRYRKVLQYFSIRVSFAIAFFNYLVTSGEGGNVP